MSSDQELMDCTPPEIRQANDAAAHDMVQKKDEEYRFQKRTLSIFLRTNETKQWIDGNLVL